MGGENKTQDDTPHTIRLGSQHTIKRAGPFGMLGPFGVEVATAKKIIPSRGVLFGVFVVIFVGFEK